MIHTLKPSKELSMMDSSNYRNVCIASSLLNDKEMNYLEKDDIEMVNDHLTFFQRAYVESSNTGYLLLSVLVSPNSIPEKIFSIGCGDDFHKSPYWKGGELNFIPIIKDRIKRFGFSNLQVVPYAKPEDLYKQQLNNPYFFEQLAQMEAEVTKKKNQQLIA